MNTFEWSGYNWKSTMEGGRISHADTPWLWYSMNQLMITKDNSIELWIHIDKNRVPLCPYVETGLMRSVEKFGYGKFSCEIRCPSGYGLWPSFWLSGDGNWPPEIDIMEGWDEHNCWFRLFDRHFPFVNPRWDTTNNIHYRDERMNLRDIKSKGVSIFKQCKNPADSFIRYEVEWLPKMITFKVNDKIVREITDDVCRKLTHNILKPEKGYEMNVIFNVWCEDPEKQKVRIDTPMIIRNFKYEKYNEQD